jgi:hypothetical protein
MIERAARDPNVDVEKLERLLMLKERQETRTAELEFDRAMAAAQEEMAPVRTNSSNPQTRSRYASYAALDMAVRPIYAAHGFSLSFTTAEGAAPDCIRVVCRVAHRDGHRERPFIDMPADGKGAKGGDVMTRTHATGSAVSYAKRYLLSMVFNLATTNDDDGNAASPAKAGTASGGTQFRPEQRGPTNNWVGDAQRDGIVDNTRDKGEMPAKPDTPKVLTAAEARAAKIKKGADDRIAALRSKTDWTKFELSDFWNDNLVWITWMEKPENNADAEYQRFYKVYSEIEINARDV